MYIFIIVLINVNIISVNGQSIFGEDQNDQKEVYSNTWTLRCWKGVEDINKLAKTYNFELSQKGKYYVLTNLTSNIDESTIESLISKIQVYCTVIKRQKYHNRATRAITPTDTNKQTFTFPGEEGIHDALWEYMWHVHEDTSPSMGIYEAWTMGYSGVGVHINIVDDGIEADHPDLVRNLEVSGNIVLNSATIYHGTQCAGLISAAMNDICVIGAAYNSTISDVTVLGDHPVNDHKEAIALTHNLEHTDIYSNSWGPPDSGYHMEGPEELTKDALERGVNEGRNGLGALYVWASGNGGDIDECNADGYSNSIYTISVTTIGIDRQPAFYSEKCSSVMVATYGGDNRFLDGYNPLFPTIATTAEYNSCTTEFQGSSASCPIAAGIIALVLEANPLLTWRDVQHLLVRTSIREGLDVHDWTINGVGIQVSHQVGFGLINAANLIQLSKTWVTVPQQEICKHELVDVGTEDGQNSIYTVSNFTSSGCNTVRYIEHVEVTVSLYAERRGSIEIALTSPSGTRSILLHRREYDFMTLEFEFTFMTLHSWGESPSGIWELELNSTLQDPFILKNWSMTIYGTYSPPVSTILTKELNVEADDNTNNTNNIKWIITGVVIGGAVAIATSVVIVYFLKKKMHTNIIRVQPLEN